MKQSVNNSDFHTAFNQMGRGDQFSYEARNALFEYLEEYEQDCETEIELDVIALCCDYSEHGSFLDWAIGYHTENQFDDEFGDVSGDPEDLRDKIREYIQDRGQLIEFDGGIIVSSF